MFLAGIPLPGNVLVDSGHVRVSLSTYCCRWTCRRRSDSIAVSMYCMKNTNNNCKRFKDKSLRNTTRSQNTVMSTPRSRASGCILAACIFRGMKTAGCECSLSSLKMSLIPLPIVEALCSWLQFGFYNVAACGCSLPFQILSDRLHPLIVVSL